MHWIKLTDRIPNPDEHGRVLIYTEGYDFNGEDLRFLRTDDAETCSQTEALRPEINRIGKTGEEPRRGHISTGSHDRERGA